MASRAFCNEAASRSADTFTSPTHVRVDRRVVEMFDFFNTCEDLADVVDVEEHGHVFHVRVRLRVRHANVDQSCAREDDAEQRNAVRPGSLVSLAMISM